MKKEKKEQKKKTPSAKPVVGWLVMVRPAKNRSIAWWPVDAAGRDVFTCVTISDGDSLSGYVTDPTFSDSVPANYVDRVQRLWLREYRDSACDWAFEVREIKEPRERAVRPRAAGAKRLQKRRAGDTRAKKRKVRS